MTCRRFAAWLDSGMPSGEASEALAHEGVCPDCALCASAARELDALLRMEAPPAPSTFTAGVMSRVEAIRPRPVWLPASPLSWWVRALADPACALACVAGALLLGGIDRIPEIEGLVVSAKSAVIATLGARAPGLLDASTWSKVAVALAPALILASNALYRWSVRQVQDAGLAGRWR